MSALLSIYQKYAGLINRHLEGSQNFTSALDSACTRFINANAITQLPSCNQVKSAELIAKYCDLLLRKSSRNADEAEIEEQLTQIMVIFRSVSVAHPSVPYRGPLVPYTDALGPYMDALVPYNGPWFHIPAALVLYPDLWFHITAISSGITRISSIYRPHWFHIPAALVPYTGCIGSIYLPLGDLFYF